MIKRLSTIWVIARRDLSMRARSKAFRISSAILLVSVVLGIVVPAMVLDDSPTYTVAVVEAPGGLLPSAVATRAEAAGVDVTVREVTDRAAGIALVDAGTVVAAVVPGEIVWRSAEDVRLAAVLEGAVAQAAVTESAHTLGLTPTQLAELFAPAAPTVTLLRPEPDRGPQTVVAMIGMILLFVALNFYGAYVLTGVVEEKSSRVVEVLLARVATAEGRSPPGASTTATV
jgi:ABC-2 type transport system permease protein